MRIKFVGAFLLKKEYTNRSFLYITKFFTVENVIIDAKVNNFTIL